MNEKISVLIPVYNRENFIERAVHSILNQTYQNLEILVYDDGSTDNTKEILQELKIKDNRIRILYSKPFKNQGVGHARNVLLQICETKYAVWQDSDDISHPERIEQQFKKMNEDKLVYCGWENLKTKIPGTTRGFATLMFPVDKYIGFPENMKFGAEDAEWRKDMEKVYQTVDIKDVLYSIDFHGDRIGSWKRKIDKQWGGRYDLKEIENLSYEDAINKYKKDIQ